jgi:hypothetical protein
LRGIQHDSQGVFPFPAFRLLMAFPGLLQAEQAIEAWRLRKWLERLAR